MNKHRMKEYTCVSRPPSIPWCVHPCSAITYLHFQMKKEAPSAQSTSFHLNPHYRLIDRNLLRWTRQCRILARILTCPSRTWAKPRAALRSRRTSEFPSPFPGRAYSTALSVRTLVKPRVSLRNRRTSEFPSPGRTYSTALPVHTLVKPRVGLRNRRTSGSPNPGRENLTALRRFAAQRRQWLPEKETVS